MSSPLRPPPVLRLLSRLHSWLGDRPSARRLANRLGLRRLSRAWLRRTVVGGEGDERHDVTVLIGVRDRADHRIVNALRSIRAQTLPSERIHTLVVDWGSEPACARFIERACRRHGATYLAVDDVDVWSRARCLNVGLRRAETTFLMTSDADILLSPDYLADALRLLRREPLSVVCSPMLDLPEESTEAARRSAEEDAPFPMEEWRDRTTPRLDWDFHPSIAVTFTAFYQLVRGYDEFYEVWGKEDEDLLERLERLGLKARPLASDSFYMHQWHPKHEGVPGGEDSDHIARNREHFRTTHSLLRNGREWGRPDADVAR